MSLSFNAIMGHSRIGKLALVTTTKFEVGMQVVYRNKIFVIKNAHSIESLKRDENGEEFESYSFTQPLIVKFKTGLKEIVIQFEDYSHTSKNKNHYVPKQVLLKYDNWTYAMVLIKEGRPQIEFDEITATLTNQKLWQQ